MRKADQIESLPLSGSSATRDTISVIDLFAGCGGFAQGFREYRPLGYSCSPFRSVAAVEIDAAAAATFAVNFGDDLLGVEHIFSGDIAAWDGASYTGTDVMLGGPPCQGFSALGNGNSQDPRNRLLYEYIRVVKAIEPKIFVIENVDRFMKSFEYATLFEATQPGGALQDYVVTSELLNAADYGVPQTRKRVIVLGTRRDLISLHPHSSPLRHPARTHFKQGAPMLLNSNEHAPWVPAASIFSQTPEDTVTTDLPDRICSPLGVELPGPFETRELHVGRNPTDLSLQRYREIPPGGNRWDLPSHLSTESWMRHRTGSGDVMGRMHMDRPSVTIRTEFFKPEKGRYLHPYADRPITHYEAALIQGFPEDFLWCGNKIPIARQIGNAVPVGLSRAIAGAVHDYLNAIDG